MAQLIQTNTSARTAECSGVSVLQVVPRLVAGGAERSAVDIAIALARAGGRSFVASAGGPMVRELERNGVHHVMLPVDRKNPLVMQANIGRLEQLIRAEGIGIVHARSRAPAWSAKFAASRSGVHFITTFHGIYDRRNPLKRWYNQVMARGERVIANSKFVAQHLQEVYRLPDHRVVTIPRGIDVRNFDPAAVRGERMADLARRWRLPDGATIVLMPARLTRRKGHRVLIDAISRTDRQDVFAVLLGSADGHAAYRGELLQLIAGRGLENRMRLVDHCNDMPAAYMLADVVVCASDLPETFGRVIVEAQAMGKPVIATDHGGARETLLAGQTGWLVPPADAASIAAALQQACDLDRDLRLAVAEAARAHVIEHFTLEQMCARTLAVYVDLLRNA